MRAGWKMAEAEIGVLKVSSDFPKLSLRVSRNTLNLGSRRCALKFRLAQVFFLFLIALTGLAYGQTPEKLPSFDAADVHSTPKSPNPNVQSLGGFARQGRYQFRNATMVDLIAN